MLDNKITDLGPRLVSCDSVSLESLPGAYGRRHPDAKQCHQSREITKRNVIPYSTDYDSGAINPVAANWQTANMQTVSKNSIGNSGTEADKNNTLIGINGDLVGILGESGFDDSTSIHDSKAIFIDSQMTPQLRPYTDCNSAEIVHTPQARACPANANDMPTIKFCSDSIVMTADTPILSQDRSSRLPPMRAASMSSPFCDNVTDSLYPGVSSSSSLATSRDATDHQGGQQPCAHAFHNSFSPGVMGKGAVGRGWVGRLAMIWVITLCVCFKPLPVLSVAVSKASPDLSKVPTPPSFIHPTLDPPVLWFVADNTPVHQTSPNGKSESLKEATFTCLAKGLPAPKYYWRKDNIFLNLNLEPERITKIPNEGTFKIRQLSPEDAGVYQCFAFNDNGTAADQPITFKQTYIQGITNQEIVPIRVPWMSSLERVCEPPMSDPAPYVFWLLKGDSTHFNSLNTSHISVVYQEGKGYLYFAYVSNADENHELQYTCAAENKVLKDYKFGNPFNLIVTGAPPESTYNFPRRAPEKQLVSENIVAIKGRSFQIHCLFSGFPVPVPSWEKLDGELDPARTSFPNFRKTLQVDDVRDGDQGRYLCRFEAMPDLSQEIEVKVEAAPYFVSHPVSRNSSEGESERFVCGAVGKPHPEITFYKNGDPLHSDEERVIVRDNVLEIQDLRKGVNEAGGDNGVYQCKAENKHGFVWANFYLNLLSFPPVIQQSPGSVEAISTDAVNISCRVFGSPAPIMEWYWNGNLLTDTSQYDYRPVDWDPGLYQLLIRSVEHRMAGTYKCAATNKYGGAEAQGNLVVMDPTKIVEGPLSTIEQSGSNERAVIAGTRVKLRCRITHDPMLRPTVTWLWQGRVIGPEDPGFILENNEDNSLVLTDPTTQFSGNYTCLAQSALDRRRESIQIVVKDVPSMPFGVYVDCVKNAKGVYVHWKHIYAGSQQTPVEYFVIQWNPGFGSREWHTHYPFHPYNPEQFNGHYYEDGLMLPVSPWGNYTFRVIARNEIGDSPASTPTKPCSIPPGPPQSNPDNVRVSGTTPTNLVVRWEPMSRHEWNGPGFHYVVRYREPGSPDWLEQPVTDPEADTLVIQELPTYHEYEVEVQARNKEGFSTTPPDPVVGHSGEGRPTAHPGGFKVKRMVNSQAATFQWEPVDEASVNGQFKGYKIVHWAGEKRIRRSRPVTTEAFFDSDATEGTVYDLTPNSKNYARIMVYNGAGDGVASPVIEFEMAPGRPDQVDALNAYPMTDTKIAVLWRPPRRPNGELRGYHLSYKLIDHESPDGELTYGEKHMELEVTDVGKTQRVITGLEPENRYEVTVVAETEAGTGEPMSIITKTLPTNVADGPPLEPSFREVGIGEDHLNLTWVPGQYDPVTRNQPVGESFYFEYKPKDEDETGWTKVHPVGDNFTVTIHGLKPATLYDVRSVSVQGVDADGSPRESHSLPGTLETVDSTLESGSAGWLVAIIVAIIILIIILIVVCLVVRNRGAKYPVSKKEYLQGRKPILKSEDDFQEFQKPNLEEENRSLTGAGSFKAESETDSMFEYGNGDTGRFTEDGSFIGQYVPHNTPPPPPPRSLNNQAFVPNGGSSPHLPPSPPLPVSSFKEPTMV